MMHLAWLCFAYHAYRSSAILLILAPFSDVIHSYFNGCIGALLLVERDADPTMHGGALMGEPNIANSPKPRIGLVTFVIIQLPITYNFSICQFVVLNVYIVWSCVRKTKISRTRKRVLHHFIDRRNCLQWHRVPNPHWVSHRKKNFSFKHDVTCTTKVSIGDAVVYSPAGFKPWCA